MNFPVCWSIVRGVRALHVATALLSVAVLAPAVALAADDFAVVESRLREQYLAKPGKVDAQKAIAEQQPQGNWPSVDYGDRSPSTWKPLGHLDRLLAIAQACAAGQAGVSQESCGKSLDSGLAYWLAKAPQSGNWWNNRIGQQLKLMPILVLGGDRIKPATRTGAIALLTGAQPGQDATNTGQNKLWFANQLLVRGVLTRNADDVRQGSELMQSVMQPVSGEGWQQDFSFHQHGALLYNNGYGLNAIEDATAAAGLLAGTRWAYAPRTVEWMADSLLNGTRWMIWGDWMDYSALGRGISRPHVATANRTLADTAHALAAWVEPARAGQLEAFSRSLASDAKRGGAPFGVRAFWRSDFLVMRSQSGYSSLRMSSQRSVGTDSDNGENIKGYWLPFGVTWSLANGDEYDDPRLWHWAYLPGVTSGDAVPPFRGNLTQQSGFVGVMDDGVYGVSGMDLKAPGISGSKAWFMVNGTLVALGAQINSSLDTPLHTTLNQVRYAGPWQAEGQAHRETGRSSLGKAQAVWHRGIGYFSMQPQELVVDVSSRSGRRSEINKAVNDDSGSGDIFTLSIDHGARPRDASYAYAIVPGIDAGTASRGLPDPWRVVWNIAGTQAISNPRTKDFLAVQRKAGTLNWVGDRFVKVSGPALIAVRTDERGRTVLTLSDPTHAQAAIDVSWRLDGGQTGQRRIALPQGDQAGQPVQVAL